MRKTTKTLVTTTLALSTLFGVGVTSALTETSIAHAESKATTNTTHSKANATSAYYNYKGYAGQDVSFVLDKHFKNAVKAENVTFNGIKLKATTSSKNVKKYDQYFRNVSKDGKTASLLDLNVTGKMTLDQLNKTYGKDLQKVNNHKHNTTGIYFYQPNSKGMTVWFDVDNGKVDRVVMGYSTVKQAMKETK
ncbi:hypothetical protein BUZ22_01575 [Staphylococcus haemolyticus]|uniref:Immunodominant staphylococcal antigen B n=1 Tax=Staphylococcus haemolyticus TaxID=1283 RepID=A0AB38PH38_STAHA|nr:MULTISPECIES: hypothetical protein [Staphylococcus]KAA2277081.1 hypothetical protein F1592_03315 [Staphylococcus sp. GDX7P312P]KAA2279195.1 hypothetical protein F1591_09195 [Staphylococcus sp. GDX7P459A]KGJ25576.1 hypothetical protein ES24_09305 [Staphylococcus haemolyticus]KGJ26524.1 hypothetical protein ES23_09925 [Staphylococcus haemolyticus]MCE4953846.1 hypothetical protein [Staphylococcus haemolyticus]